MPFDPVWKQQLQPASYNGIPFFVEGDVYSTGRRVAVHEYPYRDNPFVEDLGLNRRTVEFSGFLVGDDVYEQRDALKKAAEKAGDGTLVHPSMGSLKVALIGAGFTESVDKGRVVEIRFQFIVVDDKPRWPNTTVDTQQATTLAVSDMQSAAQGDFFSQVSASIAQGSQGLNGAISSANQFISVALRPLRDAARLVNSVSGVASMVGVGSSLGRFTGGLSSFSSPINSVLGGVSRSLSEVNRIELGTSLVLTNAAAVTASVSEAFTATSGLLAAL